MHTDPFGAADGIALGELIATRKASVEEVTTAYIDRIERLDPRLNAVVHRYYPSARRRARDLDSLPTDTPRGPLFGVPMLLKDLLCEIAGRPITCGSAFFRDFNAPRDSELYLRYERAGLVALGRTNCPELGLTPVTEPEYHGPTRNPWSMEHTTGGSSGGAAAAVASGMIPIGHGGDGAGSLRIPASCCGLFGLKPSRGRTPHGPDASEHWLGMMQEHVITRSVRDSAAMLDLSDALDVTMPYGAPTKERPYLEEIRQPPKKLRIGFSTVPPLPAMVHADCKAAVDGTARLCADLGHEVSEMRFDVDPGSFAMHLFTVICACTTSTLLRAEAETGRKGPKGFETTTRLMGLVGDRFSARELLAAHQELQTIARRYCRLFERYDVVLTPTLARPPVRLGTFRPGAPERVARRLVVRARLPHVVEVHPILQKVLEISFAFIPFTPIANIAGTPSMSVPLTWNQGGLPVGSCFTACVGGEGTLFRLAAQLERAQPWASRLPPLNAFH